MSAPNTSGGFPCSICGVWILPGQIHFCGGSIPLGNLPAAPVWPSYPSYGWICPRCGKVNAPSQMSCWCPVPDDFKPAAVPAPGAAR